MLPDGALPIKFKGINLIILIILHMSICLPFSYLKFLFHPSIMFFFNSLAVGKYTCILINYGDANNQNRQIGIEEWFPLVAVPHMHCGHKHVWAAVIFHDRGLDNTVGKAWSGWGVWREIKEKQGVETSQELGDTAMWLRLNVLVGNIILFLLHKKKNTI